MFETFYRLLRWAFPASLRRRWGDDMAQLVRDQMEEARARGESRAKLLALVAWDALSNGLAERLSRRAASVRRALAADVGKDDERKGEGRMNVPKIAVSWLDVKLGLRMLVKQPGLTLVAVLALAIGIPVGLAPTHLVDAFEAPLPVDEGERIQLLRNFSSATARVDRTTLYEFARWGESLTTFDALGALRPSRYNIDSEQGLAPPVEGVAITASTFVILRVPPLLGRTLVPSDEAMGGPSVVVIGYDIWQSRLGGARDVVGRAIRIGGVAHTVVGVMPAGFMFPSRHQLWLPLRERITAEPFEALPLAIYGRLADGASPADAQTELDVIGRRMATEFPETHSRLRAEVVPFSFIVFSGRKGGFKAMGEFYVVQILALLLVVVSCSNVGMLIFARTATRASELAVRTALGASRWRIVSQVFTESLVLAVVSAGVGLLLMDTLPRLIPSRVADVLPYWVDLGVSRTTVSWALSLAVFSAAIAGVIPALRVTGKSVQRNMQRASAGRSGIRFGGISSALIVADVAIAVAVVGLAAAVSNVLKESGSTSDGVGIQADEFLSVQLRLPEINLASGASPSDRSAFVARMGETQQALVRRLQAEPAVRGVAVGSVLPRMSHSSRAVEPDGEIRSHDSRAHWVRTARVDIGFFRALEQPILYGRGFEESDLGELRSAVVVNTTFVQKVLDGGNPIGRRVRYKSHGEGDPSPWYEIVGVVGHLGMHHLLPDEDEGIYHPLAPGELNPVRLAIHVGDDPASLTPRVRALANEVDPTAGITDPIVLDDVYEGDWYLRMASTAGIALLVGILLALAASGLYAVMSFTVAERTREIGIRTALGGRSGVIAFTVARRALGQLAAGVLLGMPVAGYLFALQTRSTTGG